MRKVLLNRRFVFLVALWAIFISLPPSGASAMPSDSVSAFSAASVRQAQIERVMAVLARPEARVHLALMGIDQKEIKQRLAGLDDQGLAAVSDQADKVKAGGDALGVIVVLLVIALLVLLVVKLSDKTIEIKDKK